MFVVAHKKFMYWKEVDVRIAGTLIIDLPFLSFFFFKKINYGKIYGNTVC